MSDDSNGIGKAIRIFLEENGIDPIYASTVVCIIVTLSYWKQFKNWDKIPKWSKGLVLSATFATSILVIISLLKIVGIIRF